MYSPLTINFKVCSPFISPKILVISQDDCSCGSSVVKSGGISVVSKSGGKVVRWNGLIVNQTHLRTAHVPEEIDN